MTFPSQWNEISWNMAAKCGCSETSPITVQHGLIILIKENIEGMLSICLHCHLRSVIHCGSRFEYITPRIRLTPKDLEGTKLDKPKVLHFVCSPSRAASILSEVEDAWKPITIFEPMPVRPSPNSVYLATGMTIFPSL